MVAGLTFCYLNDARHMRRVSSIALYEWPTISMKQRFCFVICFVLNILEPNFVGWWLWQVLSMSRLGGAGALPSLVNNDLPSEVCT